MTHNNETHSVDKAFKIIADTLLEDTRNVLVVGLDQLTFVALVSQRIANRLSEKDLFVE